MIALIDCNAFFCSCERLFRPDLWRSPVGVLSNNDGCFISRTKELKALGVKMGQPYFQVKELCEKNKVAVFSANFALYTNISERVMSFLRELCPEIEVYSVDEAFLDLRSMPQKNLEEFARQIRQKIFEEIGIPVSVGVAKTKVMAKLANHFAKKREGYLKGVFVLDSLEREEAALHAFPIEEVWGVGGRSSEKMKMLGIKTALDLREYDDTQRIQKIFTKVGRMIQDELRGIRCFEVKLKEEKKKQITASRSFGTPVTSKEKIKEAVAHHIDQAMEKLRRQKSLARGVWVSFRTSPFAKTPFMQKGGEAFLTYPTQDTRKMIQAAWEVVDQVFEGGHLYAKAGIGLLEVSDADAFQLDLFQLGDSEKEVKLMETMDYFKRRDGNESLRPLACVATEQSWKMKQSMKSPRYLTGWTELAKVR